MPNIEPTPIFAQNFFGPASPWVNPETGTLTPQAVRFLQAIWSRTGYYPGQSADATVGLALADTDVSDVPPDVATFLAQVMADDWPGQDGAPPIDLSADPQDVPEWFAAMLADDAGRNGVGAPQQVTMAGSPQSYYAVTNGTMCVSGGTVSAIAIVRTAVTVTTGQTAGSIPLCAGDTLTITYTVAPTVYFLPS